jgi:hypothetical protein
MCVGIEVGEVVEKECVKVCELVEGLLKQYNRAMLTPLPVLNLVSLSLSLSLCDPPLFPVVYSVFCHPGFRVQRRYFLSSYPSKPFPCGTVPFFCCFDIQRWMVSDKRHAFRMYKRHRFHRQASRSTLHIICIRRPGSRGT